MKINQVKTQRNISLTGFGFGSSLEMFVLDKSDVWCWFCCPPKFSSLSYHLKSDPWTLLVLWAFKKCCLQVKVTKETWGWFSWQTRFASVNYVTKNFATIEVILRFDCKYIWRGSQILIEKLYGNNSFNNKDIEDRAYTCQAQLSPT